MNALASWLRRRFGADDDAEDGGAFELGEPARAEAVRRPGRLLSLQMPAVVRGLLRALLGAGGGAAACGASCQRIERRRHSIRRIFRQPGALRETLHLLCAARARKRVTSKLSPAQGLWSALLLANYGVTRLLVYCGVPADGQRERDVHQVRRVEGGRGG